MPQRGAVNPNAFAPLSEFLTGTDPWTKGANERRRLDLDAEREQQRTQIENERLAIQRRQADLEAERNAQALAERQAREKQAQTELLFKQESERRAQRDADYEDWQRSNPSQPPVAPSAPIKPTELPDPMTNYDEPTEITGYDTLISQGLGGRLMTTEGQPVGPDTTVPMDSIAQIRLRAFQYIQAGVNPAEAATRAMTDIVGEHPTYAPAVPASSGFFGLGATEASPARINPTTGLAPAPPIDMSQGPGARNKAARDAYAKEEEDYLRRRQAYETYRPPVYPGYPWKDHRAANGEQPPEPVPAPKTAPAAPAEPRKKQRLSVPGLVIEELD